MNAKQEAKLNMYTTVILLCENNPAIVALLLAFQTTYDAFKTTVKAINNAAAELEAQTSGLAVTKNTAKKNLADIGSGMAGLVYAYAASIKDDTLKGAMKISFSDITDAKDDEVAKICQSIYTAANDNIAALADYGLTPAILTVYQNAINGYSNAAPQPRLSIAEKKAIRANMATMFTDADKLLKEQLDKTAEAFRANGNKAFLDKYLAARVIVDPGSFKTVLKLLVVNSVNQMPLRSAKCYRDDSATPKKSTVNGFVTYKNIEEGNHTFKLKHKLFRDVEATVMISHDEKKTVTVAITPM